MKKILFIGATLAATLFAGTIDGVYSAKRINIRISEVQGAMQFSLLGAGSGSMSSACDLSGVALVQSPSLALFKTSSDSVGGCSVSFDFSNSPTLVVRSKGCQMYCTDRSSFDGEYKKTR